MQVDFGSSGTQNTPDNHAATSSLDEEHIEKLLERFVEVLLLKQSSSAEHQMLINIGRRMDDIDHKISAITCATQKPSSSSTEQSKTTQHPITRGKVSTRSDASKQYQFSISQWLKDNKDTLKAILAFFAISFFSILFISMIK